MDEIPIGALAVDYRRCSDSHQVNSLDDQNTEIDRVVRKFKLTIVKTYEDAGISGSTIDEREGLKRALAEAGTLGATVVLVYDISRLTRGGLGDFWTIIADFARQGIRIYNCQRGLFVNEDDLGNALMSSMEAIQAREHNKKMAQDVTRSLLANVRDRGNAPGAIPAYGFDRRYIDENGKPFQQVCWNEDGTKDILNPVTLEVITTLSKGTPYVKIKNHRVQLVPSSRRERVERAQLIFQLAESMGYTGISNHLNNLGIPSPRGGKWNCSTIRDILLNPAFGGEVSFNRTTKSRYVVIQDGQPVLRKDRPGKLKFDDNRRDQWILIPDSHEPLVAPERLDAVNAALAARSFSVVKTGRGRNNRVYPLSGILTCGNCGGPMQGMCPDEKYRRYICSTRRKHGQDQCVPCSLLATKVEAFVVDNVREYLTSDCAKQHLRTGLERIYDDRRRSLGDFDAAQRDMETFQKQKDDLFAQLRKTGAMEMFGKQIESMVEEEQRLKRRLSAARAELGETLDKAGFVERCLELFEDHVLRLKGGCENGIRESLRALGTRVVYHPLKKEGGLEIHPFGASANG